ncbi:MAG: hypothetical protein WBM52_01505 [Thiogranum sp.]
MIGAVIERQRLTSPCSTAARTAWVRNIGVQGVDQRLLVGY